LGRRRRVHDENAFKRSLASHGVQLVELLARRDDGNPAIGVSHKHGNLFAGQSDAIALLRAPAEKSLGERANPLVDLVRGNGLPQAELVLPEYCAGICGSGDAAEQVVDGGERSILCHFWVECSRWWGFSRDYYESVSAQSGNGPRKSFCH